MRTLRRPSITPPTLADGGKAARFAENLRKRWQQGKKLTFSAHWTEGDVRGALAAMQGWVCAYCLRKIDDKCKGDVEHFRPKGGVAGQPEHGGYWWLAYSFTNYYLTCNACNQKDKKSVFPLIDEARRITYEDRSGLADEPRLLIDPAIDPVDDWLDFQKKEAWLRLVPSSSASETARRRIEESCDCFKLNGSSALFQARNRAIDAIEEATKGGGDFQKIRRRASRYQAHSHIYRWALVQAGLNPPEPAEELLWHLETLSEQIDFRIEMLVWDSSDKFNLRLKNEFLWTLAFLWAEQYWQYQVKTADVGLRAKKLLEEKISQ